MVWKDKMEGRGQENPARDDKNCRGERAEAGTGGPNPQQAERAPQSLGIDCSRSLHHPQVSKHGLGVKDLTLPLCFQHCSGLIPVPNDMKVNAKKNIRWTISDTEIINQFLTNIIM